MVLFYTHVIVYRVVNLHFPMGFIWFSHEKLRFFSKELIFFKISSKYYLPFAEIENHRKIEIYHLVNVYNKLWQDMEDPLFSVGQLTISMATFNSKSLNY